MSSEMVGAWFRRVKHTPQRRVPMLPQHGSTCELTLDSGLAGPVVGPLVWRHVQAGAVLGWTLEVSALLETASLIALLVGVQSFLRTSSWVLR